MRRIGVDVGGTFTDLILVDEATSRVTVEKVASTPDDPARGVADGVRRLCEKAGVRLADVDNLLHGTTVATNIALTHTGAEVGMLTTEGFRDILHIGRHKKPLNFSLQQELPWQSRPLVKRRHRLTVAERVTAPHGEVLVALDEDEVRAQVRRLRAAGVEAVAVCLLHSYLNPEHEQRIKQIVLEEFPQAYLSVSNEVLPLYREFERFSTVALNAYVGPKVARYLAGFEEAMRASGFAHEVQLMQSSGGMATIASAAQRPVNLLMSGPVAGLIGGIWAGRMAGFDNVVTLDIGGTSADIGVAAGGELRMRHLLDTKVGDYQAMVPMVDIDTIGAGGGSIAYVDEGDVFRVGPASAGADPGPACYGLGGTLPTSTDAQVLLGRLRTDRGLLDGTMRLDAGLARTAVASVAGRLDMSEEEAALGALQIQKFGMTQAIELSSVRRGYDPREFTLVAAGGAGPLFACDIALELQIARVLVPPHPGILSATGLLATDLQHEFVATDRHALKALDAEALERRLDALSAQAVEQLERDGVPEDRRLVRRLADCRYVGQGYEVRFDLPAGAIDEAWTAAVAEAFHRAHEAEYGHRFDAEIEIVNIRAIGIGRIEELRWAELEGATDGDASRAIKLEREVVFDVDGRAERRPTPFYDRGLLRAGDVLAGPAIIEQYDTTTVVPPGLRVEIDTFGNLVVDCRREPAALAARETELATPILMRVIGGALSAIAKEMAGVLFRMSYSSIIRESEDLGAGLFDRDGNELAESDSTPMFMGAMPKIVKGVLSLLGDDINEGDVILHNDPYLGATHSPDAAIIVPVFFEGELVGFTGASAHLLDIGGAYPGLAIDLVDNWSEGSMWRAVKLSDAGVRQEAMWRHVLGNTRTPTQNRGDMEAMIAACELARRRYVELLARYGKDTVLGAAQAWVDYSERMLRQEIAKVPDGVYETETGWLDDDGVNRGTMLPVNVKVVVEGDELTVDLTGSSAEVPTGFNCPFEGTTMSAMSLIARMIFLDEAAFPVFVPQNEGMLKPVKVIAPEGSIFNPRFPRACFARFCQVQRAVDLVLRALAPVVPDKVTAGNSAHLHFISYSGFDQEEGEYWVYLEVDEGSYGGRQGRDGLDTVDALIANTRNNPIEELEWRFPMRTERYELREEPAAPGQWRGGIGMVRVNRFLVDTMVSCEGERHDGDLPWGAFGGHDGVNASTTRNEGMDGEHAWPSKFTGHRLKAGDTITIRVPSSGGYGDPLLRDPDKVLADVLDGFVTLESTARDYGVVIDQDAMTVDPAATRRLRDERHAPVPGGSAGP
jgi:5-oxoprolinase (ATP-hydrolysing)